jgi:ABC-type sulfate/molybdate transport systems ATPase subunit
LSEPASAPALRVSLQIAPGRRGPHGLVAECALRPGISVLFGASGAGKTSLLCAIAGLLRPDAGHIALGSQVLFDHVRGVNLPPERRRVGLVFQSLSLFPHLTARQNVAFGAPGPARARRDVAERWLARMRVAHVAERKPGTLSGGEAQRVALARALAAAPRVLLLDEPFSALDEELRAALAADVASIVAELGLMCLLVTHDRAEGLRLSQRVFELSQGRLTQLGSHDPTRSSSLPSQ